MRKFLALLALIVSIFTLAACGSSHGASSDNKNPTTLIGEWSQINASSDGWMTASISGDSIQVNLRSRGSSSIFWLGSFDTSHKPYGKFNVVSLGDQDAMKWDIMASGEKQKTFTYDSGVLSFGFSAMGSSTTVRMVKNKKPEMKVWPTSKRKAVKTPSYNRPSPQKSKTPTPRTTSKPTVKQTASTPKSTSTKK
jgi:hypothetical protein